MAIFDGLGPSQRRATGCLPQSSCRFALLSEAIAVTDAQTRLTYIRLNSNANQVAHYLQQLGCAPGVIVGLCMSPGAQLVVAMLAVMKAGGAYCFMDPHFPAARTRGVLKEVRPLCIIMDNGMAHAGVPWSCGVSLCLPPRPCGFSMRD